MLEAVGIIYDNPDVLVVNKPAGLMVHSDGKSSEPSLTDWVIEHYPKLAGVGGTVTVADGSAVERAGIVHRLDRETSGLLIIAKNQITFDFLTKQFEDREIGKTYRLIVTGRPSTGEGIINLAIGRHKKDFRKWAVPPMTRGKVREALTYYKVLETRNNFSLIEASPKTGRTHQIRVHMAALNLPIVGDKIYGRKNEVETFGLERLALHCYALEFRLPNNEWVTLSAPYPADFATAVKRLQA